MEIGLVIASRPVRRSWVTQMIGMPVTRGQGQACVGGPGRQLPRPVTASRALSAAAATSPAVLSAPGERGVCGCGRVGAVLLPVTDWSEHPPQVPIAFEARYESGGRRHPHVHGANLGIRASAHLAAGGFTPLRTAEDHALVAAAGRAGRSVLRASNIPVRTSARRQACAPFGFGHLLRTLPPPAAPVS
jgi:hypothetical protein